MDGYYGYPNYYSNYYVQGMGDPCPWAPWIDMTYYGPDYVWTDEDIAFSVRDNIIANPYIRSSAKENIEIDVDAGVVTLKGEVKSKQDKFLAYADAFWTVGVVDVEDKIEVREPKKKS